LVIATILKRGDVIMKYLANIVRILFLALFLFLLANGKVMLWLALFAASLIAALIFGRVYCGYICPMNTLMIPTQWLSKKLKIQTTKTPKWLKNGYFTWITLVISIVAMLASKKALGINLPILPFWLVMSVLVTLRYKPAVFHNLLCPFGALQRTFGKFARLSKRVDIDTCIGCKLCETSCPSAAIIVNAEDKKATINPALCHQCGNCSQVCPTSAIHYKSKSDK
jgi:polyferredoxin